MTTTTRRRRLHVDSVPMTVWLPRQLVNQFRLLALDPATGRVRYGFQAHVVEELLRGWLLAQRTPTPTTTKSVAEGDASSPLSE